MGLFKEPIKAMRDRVGDLVETQKRHKERAAISSVADDRKLHEGLAHAIEKEIVEYNAAIEYLEAAVVEKDEER